MYRNEIATLHLDRNTQTFKYEKYYFPYYRYSTGTYFQVKNKKLILISQQRNLDFEYAFTCSNIYRDSVRINISNYDGYGSAFVLNESKNVVLNFPRDASVLVIHHDDLPSRFMIGLTYEWEINPARSADTLISKVFTSEEVNGKDVVLESMNDNFNFVDLSGTQVTLRRRRFIRR